MTTADISTVEELLPLPGTDTDTGDPSAWGLRHAHDPTVVRDGDGTYYMFSTDAVANAQHVPAGVHIRTSPDLVDWTYAGTAFDGVPSPAADWSGARGLWAPEVVRWPAGGWHMYYSASTFGSNTSAIGLAVAQSPAGPWEDRGPVVATRSGEHSQNAIDAAVVFDAAGAPWLTYGSFFSGIHILPLDGATGEPLEPGDPGTCIARRSQSVEGAVEGAYILYRPEEDRYVLFTSYDSLFSTYNVRVAVADRITGPYRDARGHSLTDLDAPPSSIGTKVLGSYQFDGGTGWLAPGHNSVLTQDGPEGQPEHFLVHHTRFAADPTQHVAQLRRLFFNAAGWPVVSPQPYAGRGSEVLAGPEAVAGTWQLLRFDPESTALVPAVAGELQSVGPGPEVSDGSPVQATLRIAGAQDGSGAAIELDALLFGSWDWARSRPALSFSGIDRQGVAWSGTKEVQA
ncbi:arabinan endo-1,5-alpha-L-arabinosidase [Arthrobacter sp. HMWF013]|uniref:arabinan endo-1,5-alpha-L-arabinosidase n=1 Tax=Arthrobacter sp. HMWF013 TaxID=2056849 RepID=UPI000D37DE6A|nr:arabinan endo-1,5-alpha-L-arabinosidase [Arthrobacter sp. HMWF013]PTT65496.1 arabinan endo-1,5-alpha-L-arabinosidase [Arthrobacter sp. HMWF013]